MTFLHIFYVLNVFILSQSGAVLSTNRQCYKAKTCVHDNIEKCGVSSSGTPRLFLDSCDIFEYNCLENTDFTRSPTMAECKLLPLLDNKPLPLIAKEQYDKSGESRQYTIDYNTGIYSRSGEGNHRFSKEKSDGWNDDNGIGDGPSGGGSGGSNGGVLGPKDPEEGITTENYPSLNPSDSTIDREHQSISTGGITNDPGIISVSPDNNDHPGQGDNDPSLEEELDSIFVD